MLKHTKQVAEGGATAAPLFYFVLVAENIGSSDGPRFGEHVYDDFDQARAALDAFVKKELARNKILHVFAQAGASNMGIDEDDDRFRVVSYLDEATKKYGMNVSTIYGEVHYAYFLQKFSPVLKTGRGVS